MTSVANVLTGQDFVWNILFLGRSRAQVRIPRVTISPMSASIMSPGGVYNGLPVRRHCMWAINDAHPLRFEYKYILSKYSKGESLKSKLMPDTDPPHPPPCEQISRDAHTCMSKVPTLNLSLPFITCLCIDFVVHLLNTQQHYTLCTNRHYYARELALLRQRQLGFKILRNTQARKTNTQHFVK